MNKEDVVLNTWISNVKENFVNANNIIVKARWKTWDNKKGKNKTKHKCYLASKVDEEIYFYDNVIVFSHGKKYEFDENLNLKKLNCPDKIVRRFKWESFFYFPSDRFMNNSDSLKGGIITLPLCKPINFDEFIQKHNNHEIVLEAKIKDEEIEQLLEKQNLTIESDANQMYDKAFNGTEVDFEY
ncbi:MAG: hypothetical protein REH79_00670 [Spiroplasma sp.]|nr:hypothetical protein [Spiroplasma sp.]